MTASLTLGVALIALGFLLMLGDLLLPSGGVFALVGVGIAFVGVMFLFIYDNTVGIWALLGVVVGVPVVGSILIRLWPYTPSGKQFTLPPPEEEAATLPLHREMEEYRGRIGKAASALRPAGVVDFDGRRIDCITEGMLVEPGQWVRCVEVRGATVVVRPMERPDATPLENMDIG